MGKTKQKSDEYKNMRDGIQKLNPNRGCSDPNKSKGYYAEVINATENNLNRIEKNQTARVVIMKRPYTHTYD